MSPLLESVFSCACLSKFHFELINLLFKESCLQYFSPVLQKEFLPVVFLTALTDVLLLWLSALTWLPSFGTPIVLLVT